MQASCYFLGANSRHGFYSLYDSFPDFAAGEFLRVIKGGPGCGKSTLMRRIGSAAEAAGLEVEYILCSGDPDSLDAVRIPALGAAYVDGTAPHVIEAGLPGAASDYLDMSRFLDKTALRGLRGELEALNRQYKALYASAYDLLNAGAALLPRNRPGLWGARELEKLDKKVSALAARELRSQDKSPKTLRRFLSAYSCKGRLTLTETLAAGGYRVCLLDNGLGMAPAFLERMAASAAARGYDRVLCPDPLEPEKLEALLLPEAELAFLAAAEALPAGIDAPWRHLRLDALAEKACVAESRAALRRQRKDSALVLDHALSALAEAKALHDTLEALYRPHVDFAGAAALAEAEKHALGI